MKKSKDEVNMAEKIGFFVDCNGNTKSNQIPIQGCHFEYQKKDGYEGISIVVSKTGEVVDEFVFWPSLEALAAAGVDVTQTQCPYVLSKINAAPMSYKLPDKLTRKSALKP